MSTTSIQYAKERVTIPMIGARYFPEWRPGKSCHSPFRDDRNPSFSVFDDGRAFKDFATGEAGDAIDFLMLAARLTKPEAIRRFIEMAGGDMPPPERPRSRLNRPLAHVTLPAGCRHGTDAELRRLAYLRNLNIDALRIASKRDLLFFADMQDQGVTCPAWIVTDPSRHAAQARRLDGRPWACINAKAWTLKGSVASWPVGIRQAAEFAVIMLTEGGPDFLTAIHFAYAEEREKEVAPVCMFGAKNKIHPDALTCFKGKRIRIYPHNDQPGQQAARIWADQIRAAGGIVDCFDLANLETDAGEPIKDLNDLTHVHPDLFELDRDLWAIVPEVKQ